jgi:hypothetical protein
LKHKSANKSVLLTGYLILFFSIFPLLSVFHTHGQMPVGHVIAAEQSHQNELFHTIDGNCIILQINHSISSSAVISPLLLDEFIATDISLPNKNDSHALSFIVISGQLRAPPAHL